MKELIFCFVAALASASIQTADLQEASVDARFDCEPSEVEVGEPFDLVLELTHPVSADVFDIGDRELVLDDTWVLLGRRLDAPRVLDDAAEVKLARTRRIWTVASLEPGSRRLAEAASALVADARVLRVDAAGASVEVKGVLGPAEDAPRPPRGFPVGFGEAPRAAPSPLRWIALGFAAAFWAGVLGLLVRRMRRGRAMKSKAAPAPLERLAALRAQAVTSPGAVRDRHFELTHLVRGAWDQKLNRAGAGRTDSEWLADLQGRGSVDPELLNDLGTLFETAESVKYGGNLPTSWALEESYARVQKTLACIEQDLELSGVRAPAVAVPSQGSDAPVKGQGGGER